MFFGFFIQNDGFASLQIPTIFKELSSCDRNKIFIAQFNAAADESLKISTKSCFAKKDLLDIFNDKIRELLCDASHKRCELSDYLIGHFNTHTEYKLNRFFTKVPTHPAAKLIQMMWCKENRGIYFESSWFFCNYVYEKISKCHYDKEITYKDGLILVTKNGENLVAVMPCFKYMNMNEPQLANEEIRKAYKMLEKINVGKFYIAFPKNEDFKRHIVVKQSDNDINSKLSLIPYSISHKIVYNNQSKTKF